MHLSDEILIDRVAQRDPNALEILYDRHASIVLGIALQIVGDRAAAEDILQETFWQVWQSAVTYQPQSRPFTRWLFRIVRNLAVETRRQRDLGHQVRMEIEDKESIPEPDPKTRQLRNTVRSRAFEQRRVIEMAYFYGLTRQEISDATGISLDKISNFARLGLQQLQEVLENIDEIE